MRDFRSEALLAHPEYIGVTRDFKAWAKRLLWREKNSDKEITALQSKFAHEALGLEKKQG